MAPEQSFESFFRSEYPALVALVVAVSGDRAGAEDIAQEALLRAQQRWARVSGLDRPGAWARRVALNLAINSRQRHRNEAVAARRLAARPPLPAAEPQTEEFWTAVRSLPRRQAAAIALYYLEDRSVLEVAAVLGCAEGTAKAHLSKGRANLARMLHEENES